MANLLIFLCAKNPQGGEAGAGEFRQIPKMIRLRILFFCG